MHTACRANSFAGEVFWNLLDYNQFLQDDDGCDGSEEVTQEWPPTRRCDAVQLWWGRRWCCRTARRRPVTNLGHVQCWPLVETLKWKRINIRKSYNHVSAFVTNARRLIESLPDRKIYTSVYDSSTLDACGGRVQHRPTGLPVQRRSSAHFAQVPHLSQRSTSAPPMKLHQPPLLSTTLPPSLVVDLTWRSRRRGGSPSPLRRHIHPRRAMVARARAARQARLLND
jgi:hypothetical protein